MRASEFARHLKAALLDAKAAGNDQVSVSAVVNFIDQVPTSDEPSAAQMEQYKAELTRWIDHARLIHESDLEMFRSVISAGQAAIRSMFLLNGGSAVALLAFVGHLATEAPDRVPSFSWTLLPFASGVFVAALTSGTTYLSQWLYGKHSRAGFVLNMVAIVLGLASLGCFVVGIWWAFDAFIEFSDFATPQPNDGSIAGSSASDD